MSHPTPVWITGVGPATPLGFHFDEVADALLAGKSAVTTVERFDVSEHPSKIAGQLGPIPTPEGVDPQDFAARLPLQRLLLWCAARALRDAGWWDRRADVRLGIVLGIGAEWLTDWETDNATGGRHVVDPTLTPRGSAQALCDQLGLDPRQCPVATVGAACASASYALAQGRRWVERGWVDACLAGGAELALTPMGLAGFGNLRALSRRNDDPTAASRPFDRGRDGFVLGEGGGLFVLEPADAARRRDARPYAELAGCGASSDAAHLIIPGTDPEPASRAVRLALADAGVPPDEVDYFNAHATSTPVGDVAEARVLHRALGPAARHIPISATKSMTGHLLGGAAAMGALACLAAFHRQAAPPTINLDDPDPECDLCHVANQAQPRRIAVAVSNAFGFGGSNTCIVLRRVA
jgi:3-oxoacyl-[acyl-carrier-protein] synthase II